MLMKRTLIEDIKQSVLIITEELNKTICMTQNDLNIFGSADLGNNSLCYIDILDLQLALIVF